MITQPSIPRLLDSIREELTEKVLPAIDDPTVAVSIEMMTALLSVLEIRTENEIAWMLEESAAVEEAARRLLPILEDPGGIAHLLESLRDARDTPMRLSDVSDTYQRASELLSLLTEAAYRSGNADAIATVQELFDARLAIEQEAIGTFIAVGRD